MWHPRYRVGGMCHYVVPRTAPGTKAPAGHDAPGALQALLDHAGRLCTRPRDYEVKIFGGGVQFAVDDEAGPDVGRRNVDEGLRLLAEHGLSVTTMDVLGTGARRVILDLGTGNVWVRRTDPRTNDAPGRRR